MNNRLATEQDLAAVIERVRELAEFEKEPDAVTATLEELETDWWNGKRFLD